MSGLIGKKIGMTSIFDESGKNVPCTVIEAGPCIVTQVRTEEVDGYKAVQLGFDDKTEKSTTKAGQHNRLSAPGSIGAASYPARVFKGMKMAGRMGGEKVKVLNLRVLKVMPEKNLLLVKGCVPGHKNSYVIIQK